MKKIQKLIQWIVLSFFGSTIFFVILYRFVPVPVTPLMFIRCAQQVGRGEKIRLKHHWVPLDEMSKYLPVAVMASEDQRFLQHHGFDVVEIQNAVEERMAEAAPSANKLPKTCFYGRLPLGSEKDWRHTSRL